MGDGFADFAIGGFRDRGSDESSLLGGRGLSELDVGGEKGKGQDFPACREDGVLAWFDDNFCVPWQRETIHDSFDGLVMVNG